MRKENIVPSSLYHVLREQIGKHIAVELEDGGRVEGIITKVRNQRAHISYPSAHSMKESVVPIEDIQSLRLLDFSRKIHNNTR